MYGYTPPVQQAPVQPVGQWFLANSYHDILSAPVPMDGSRSLFMLANEPTFYVVSIVNGRRAVQCYSFEAVAPQEPPASPEDRLSTLENNMAKIIALLSSDKEGSKKNESDIQPDGATKT